MREQAARFVERERVEFGAGHDQFGDSAEQAAQTTALTVQRHGARILAGQRRHRHVAADALGPEFDEQTYAVLVHRLDLGHELDRAEQVAVQESARLARIVRITRTERVRIDREFGRREVGPGDRGRQWHLGGGDQLGVERARHRQACRADVGGRQRLHRGVDLLGRAGNHALLRRIVIGNTHAVEGGDVLLDHAAIGLHRRHATGDAIGGGLRHGAAANRGQAQEGLGIDHAGRHQRGVFAITVASGGTGLQAQTSRQPQVSQLHRAERRLGMLGLRQALLLGRFGLGRERRFRPHQPRQALRQNLRQFAVGEFDRGAQFLEVDRRLAAHVDVLRALPREQQADLGRAGRCRPGELDVRRQRLAGFEVRRQGGDIGSQTVVVARRERGHAGRGRTGLRISHQTGGEAGKSELPVGSQQSLNLLQLLAESGFVGGTKHEQFIRPALRAGHVRLCVTVAVLFEHGVKIGAAKTEGGDAAAARMP